MKGIIIWEDNERATYCELINNAYSELTQYAPKTIMCSLKGESIETSKASCNKDDSYDFETGALIALMKMCGVDKVVRACNEAFSEDTFKTYATKYERELNTLKKDFDKVRDLKDFYKKNYEDVKEHYGKLGDRNKYLIEDINKKLEYIKEKDEEIKELKSDKDKSWKNYQRNIQKKQDRINELERAYKASNDDEAKLVEYYHREIKKLEAEKEKLKLDCEKLSHGYVDTDMIFCGGRACGKQYKALVEIFKKIDQKKVDAAYKEAYNTTLPVWQKEVLKQMYGIYKESKEKTELPRTLDINGVKYRKMLQIKDFGEQIYKLTVDSLIEESRAFTRKCVDEWLYKIPTRREHKWERILEIRKENDVIIEVKKEDVFTFLHEIEVKIPEITWASDVKIFEAKGTIKDIYEELITHNIIYFRLSKKNKLSYSSDLNTYLFINLDMIAYLPPMRWDLFKKGRLAVKVDYDNYKEFYEACEKELGRRPVTAFFTEDFTVSICKKDGLFEIFSIEDQKKTGRKIVNWEDVR